MTGRPPRSTLFPYPPLSRSFHVEPLLVLICHCISGAGVPLAVELKQIFPPSQTVESFGFDETAGGVLTVSFPAVEFAEPHEFVKTARYLLPCCELFAANHSE